jgi:hypothetical protein
MTLLMCHNPNDMQIYFHPLYHNFCSNRTVIVVEYILRIIECACVDSSYVRPIFTLNANYAMVNPE